MLRSTSIFFRLTFKFLRTDILTFFVFTCTFVSLARLYSIDQGFLY
jgi:hypothetical protein